MLNWLKREIRNVMRVKSGQFSVEFIIIIAFLVIALATITLPMYVRARGDAQNSSDLADAREAASILAKIGRAHV